MKLFMHLSRSSQKDRGSKCKILLKPLQRVVIMAESHIKIEFLAGFLYEYLMTTGAGEEDALYKN